MAPAKRLTIALFFLLIATAIFVLITKVDLGKIVKKEEGTATATPQTSLFPASVAGELTRAQVKDNASGDIFATEKKDGTWVILKAPKDSDTGLGVDQERINNALAMLPSLQPARTLSGIEALATYGLGDKAQYTITLIISGKEYTLTVGSKNPGASDYYVQLPGVSDVYLISTYYLDPVIELLTKPPYIQPTPDPNATPSATPEVTPSAAPEATPSATPSATPG